MISKDLYSVKGSYYSDMEGMNKERHETHFIAADSVQDAIDSFAECLIWGPPRRKPTIISVNLVQESVRVTEDAE